MPSLLASSLPPKVTGYHIGTITIRICHMEFLSFTTTEDISCRIQFWGDDNLIELRSINSGGNRDNNIVSADYAMVGSLIGVINYLSDMSELEFTFMYYHDNIGKATMSLSPIIIDLLHMSQQMKFGKCMPRTKHQTLSFDGGQVVVQIVISLDSLGPDDCILLSSGDILHNLIRQHSDSNLQNTNPQIRKGSTQILSNDDTYSNHMQSCQSQSKHNVASINHQDCLNFNNRSSFNIDNMVPLISERWDDNEAMLYVQDVDSTSLCTEDDSILLEALIGNKRGHIDCYHSINYNPLKRSRMRQIDDSNQNIHHNDPEMAVLDTHISASTHQGKKIVESRNRESSYLNSWVYIELTSVKSFRLPPDIVGMNDSSYTSEVNMTIKLNVQSLTGPESYINSKQISNVNVQPYQDRLTNLEIDNNMIFLDLSLISWIVSIERHAKNTLETSSLFLFIEFHICRKVFNATKESLPIHAGTIKIPLVSESEFQRYSKEGLSIVATNASFAINHAKTGECMGLSDVLLVVGRCDIIRHFSKALQSLGRIQNWWRRKIREKKEDSGVQKFHVVTKFHNAQHLQAIVIQKLWRKYRKRNDSILITPTMNNHISINHCPPKMIPKIKKNPESLHSDTHKKCKAEARECDEFGITLTGDDFHCSSHPQEMLIPPSNNSAISTTNIFKKTVKFHNNMHDNVYLRIGNAIGMREIIAFWLDNERNQNTIILNDINSNAGPSLASGVIITFKILSSCGKQSEVFMKSCHTKIMRITHLSRLPNFDFETTINFDQSEEMISYVENNQLELCLWFLPMVTDNMMSSAVQMTELDNEMIPDNAVQICTSDFPLTCLLESRSSSYTKSCPWRISFSDGVSDVEECLGSIDVSLGYLKKEDQVTRIQSKRKEEGKVFEVEKSNSHDWFTKAYDNKNLDEFIADESCVEDPLECKIELFEDANRSDHRLISLDEVVQDERTPCKLKVSGNVEENDDEKPFQWLLISPEKEISSDSHAKDVPFQSIRTENCVIEKCITRMESPIPAPNVNTDEGENNEIHHPSLLNHTCSGENDGRNTKNNSSDFVVDNNYEKQIIHETDDYPKSDSTTNEISICLDKESSKDTECAKYCDDDDDEVCHFSNESIKNQLNGSIENTRLLPHMYGRTKEYFEEKCTDNETSSSDSDSALSEKNRLKHIGKYSSLKTDPVNYSKEKNHFKLMKSSFSDSSSSSSSMSSSDGFNIKSFSDKNRKSNVRKLISEEKKNCSSTSTSSDESGESCPYDLDDFSTSHSSSTGIRVKNEVKINYDKKVPARCQRIAEIMGISLHRDLSTSDDSSNSSISIE